MTNEIVRAVLSLGLLTGLASAGEVSVSAPPQLTGPSATTPVQPSLPLPLQQPQRPTPPQLPPSGLGPQPITTGPMAADVKDQTNPAYLLKLAAVHMEFGALDRAEPLLHTALEHAKDPAQKLMVQQALGTCLLRKGDMKAAADLFEAALATATNPSEKARIGLSLAEAYLHANDPEKAEKTVLEVAKPDKTRPDELYVQQAAFRLLTQVWQAKPALADAYIADAEAALAKDPTDATTLERLAEVYTTVKHDPAKAAAYSEKLAATKPNDKPAQYKLAASYQQAKQFDKAIDVYKKLMAGSGERKEEVRSQAFQVGMLTLQAGKKDDAVAWMKDNFIKDISQSRDYSMLAMFYEQAGMNAEAEEALNKEAELTKSPDEKADAHLRIADIAFRKKDWAKAEEVAKSVAAEFKDNTNIQARASAMVKRVEFEKNRPAMPVVAVKPAAIQPGDVKPVAPVAPAEAKPLGPVPPPDMKPAVPTTVNTPPPAPAKAGENLKPSPITPTADPKQSAPSKSDAPADSKK